MSKGIIVVGDIHGDLNQFLLPLIEFRSNPKKYSKIIYVGDYLDRGNSDVYIYELIKILGGSNVIFLRGNHEFFPCITDYISKFDGRKVMYSFMLKLYKKLDLPMTHIEKIQNSGEYNNTVVFSHSYLRHYSLKTVKQINDLTNDWTKFAYSQCKKKYKEKHDLKEFMNIFGHEHEFIDEWKSKRSICIDFDSSYGIRKVVGSKKPFTLPRWIVLNGNKITVEKRDKIYYGAKNDYNSKTFVEILSILGIKPGNRKLFEDSYSLFLELMGNPKDYNEVFKIINKIHVSKPSMNGKMYFNNIPIEFYNKLGFKNKTLVAPDTIYDFIVKKNNGDVKKRMYGGGIMKSLGAAKEQFDLSFVASFVPERYKTLFLILLCLTILLLVITCCKYVNRRRDENIKNAVSNL